MVYIILVIILQMTVLFEYLQSNVKVKTVFDWSLSEMDTRGDLAHGSWHIFKVLSNLLEIKDEFEFNEIELEHASICALLHDVCDKKILTKPRETHLNEMRALLDTIYDDSGTVEYLVEITTSISFTKWFNGEIPLHICADNIFMAVQLADSLEQLGINGVFRVGIHIGEKHVNETSSVSKFDLMGKDNGVNSCEYFLGDTGKFTKVGEFLLEHFSSSRKIRKMIKKRIELMNYFYDSQLKEYCTYMNQKASQHK